MSKQGEMVREIKYKYDLDSPEVLSAMLQVPREEFVAEGVKDMAYDDRALAIGFGQTISQPYTVAFMTDLLKLKGREKVLEIGTGSGYQAAVLSHLANRIYTIERIKPLAMKARETLKRLGYKNVKVKTGQGELGWKCYAPFDAILVTAKILNKIPQDLVDQLKEGGVIVAPIKETMMKFIKKDGKLKAEKYGTFSFVPFIEKN